MLRVCIYIYIYLFVYIYTYLHMHIYIHHIDSYCCLHPHYISFYPSWLMILYRLGTIMDDTNRWNDVAGFNAVYIYTYMLMANPHSPADPNRFAQGSPKKFRNKPRVRREWRTLSQSMTLGLSKQQGKPWFSTTYYVVVCDFYGDISSMIDYYHCKHFSLLLNTLLTTKHHKP